MIGGAALVADSRDDMPSPLLLAWFRRHREAEQRAERLIRELGAGAHSEARRCEREALDDRIGGSLGAGGPPRGAHDGQTGGRREVRAFVHDMISPDLAIGSGQSVVYSETSQQVQSEALRCYRQLNLS
jgi:hypothetical protein